MTSEVQGGKGGDAPKAGERKKGCVIMTVKRNEGVQNFADVPIRGQTLLRTNKSGV